MAPRESRFNRKSTLKREIPALPVLDGETYLSANPVDMYLAGKSPATKRMLISHMNKVAILFDYPDYQNTPWGAIRYEHVQTLVSALQQQKLAHTTINAILSAVRGTARTAVGLQQMTADDYQRIMLVKMIPGVRLKTGRMMSQDEIRSLVKACLNEVKASQATETESGAVRAPAAYRDLAILGMMFIGGLRRSEVADLNVEDLDLEQKQARIIGKGNKERLMFLDDGTLFAVQQWLTIRGDFEGPLFLRIYKNGKLTAGRLSDQAIYNIVNKRQKQAGIAKITPHDFRKTFISTILEETGDLRIAQALAGHSDPNTTAGYDMRKQEDMREAAGKLHFPLSNT